MVGLRRHAVPDDGATGFPTDGVLRVFLTAFPDLVRAAVAREYRLIDDVGAEVPIDATVVWTRIDLRPRQPLRPNARYTLEALYTYAYGERLGDSGRLERALVGNVAMQRVWFPAVVFETGDGPAAPSPAVAVTSFTVRDIVDRGMCEASGVSASLRMTQATRPSDVVQFEMRPRGGASVVVQTLRADGATSWNLWAGSDLCNPDRISIPHGLPLETRAVVLDVVGREIGASAWVALRSHPQGSREWGLPGSNLAPWLVHSWNTPPIVRATGRTPAAPGLCPHGLEVVTRRELFPPGESYERPEQSTFALDGVHGWQPRFVPQATTTSVVGFSPRADAPTLPVTLADGVIASAADDRGPVFVTRSSLSDEVRVQALDRDGGTRWSRPITGHYDSRVVGGGRVLTTGANTALVPRPRRVDLPVRSIGAIDAVAAGSHVAVVSVDASRVLWTLLDRNGAIVRGPVAVSAGVGGVENWVPRVTYGDGLFAVAWQSNALRATYAAVVDLMGAISPAVQLAGDVRPWTPGIAAAGDRTFLATYATSQSGVDAVSLRCHATAARGAPAFINAPQ